jgi:hypothetical protein
VFEREHLVIAVAGDGDRRYRHGARRRPLPPSVGVELGPDLDFELSVHAGRFLDLVSWATRHGVCGNGVPRAARLPY